MRPVERSAGRGVLVALPTRGTDPVAALEAGVPIAGTLHAADGRHVDVTILITTAQPEFAAAHTRPPPAPAPPAPSPKPEPVSDTAFRLRLELDVEHERMILYRSLLVLEAIGLLVLLRQWLLST